MLVEIVSPLQDMNVLKYSISAKRTLSVTNSQPSRPKTSTVIELEDVTYVVQHEPEYTIHLTDDADLDALTIFNCGDADLTYDKARQIIEEYQKKDDVFCKNFLKHILLITNRNTVAEDVIQLFASWGCQVVFLRPSREEEALDGPYFFSSRGIFRAWKLYPDTQEAFVMSTIPSQHSSDSYEALNASAYGTATLCIAVPSRLYYKPTAEKPLAGIRIGVKDLFHLKGVYTGCGNRAYRNLYPPLSNSSESVQKLIDQGAIVIGKTKTVEFGGTQEVVGDWTDYSYAFNSRGDGYFVSTGSSTGSAAGIAAYDWLDIGLGTDAGGSIRDPAIAHGIYGFRPSHDGTPQKNTPAPCPMFQVSGFLCRSTEIMHEFGRHFLNTKLLSNPTQRINRIILPMEYHLPNRAVQSIVAYFAFTLSKELNAKVECISIEALWRKERPVDISESFFKYFESTFLDVLAVDYYDAAQPFIKDYEKAHNAKPYVSANTKLLWNRSTTPLQKAAALAKIQTHNSFFLSHILHSSETENAIMIVPRYDTRYRDEYLPHPKERNYEGFSSNLHASLAGLPGVVVPVGQLPYHSTISETKEFYPISASITGAKGTDHSLLALLHTILPKCGIPNSVLTGKTAFPTSDWPPYSPDMNPIENACQSPL